MILDAATIFVLALVAIYFGSFAWIEIRGRRAQNKVRTPEQNSVMALVMEKFNPSSALALVDVVD